MISKEALEGIYNVISNDTYYRDLTEESFEKVKKDLEVLDTLKVFWNRISKVDFSQSYYQYLSNYGIIPHIGALPQEVYDLIKEWLERDESNNQ